MAKKKIKIDNRVKKMAANSEWTRNVMRSMGFAAADIVKDLVPNTSEFITTSVNSVDLIKDVRSNMTTRQAFGAQFKNIPQIKEAEKAIKTIVNDIKSGNLYGSQDFGDDMDYGFDNDFFGDDGGIEFIEDEPGQSSQPTVINTLPVAKMINASTEATVNTMIAVADQQMAVETEKIMFNRKSTDAILSGLSAMNDNLATLVRFNAESTAKYHAASLKFYEDSIKMMEKYYKKDDENPFDFGTGDVFDANGNVKLGEYAKRIKQNITDMKDSSMSGMLLDNFLDPEIFKMMMSNPTKGVMKLVTNKFIPKMVQTSIKTLDESMSAILPAIIARIGNLEGGEFDKIFKIFGVKEKVDYDVKLDRYEKDAISWDGESKKALVEVIPTYLRRIESAITGEKERMFDFDKGEFINIDNAGKRYKQKLQEKEASGYMGTKIKLRDMVLNTTQDFNEAEKMGKIIEEFLAYQTKKGSLINPKIIKNKYGDIVDELTESGIAGGNKKDIEFLRNILLNLNAKDKTKMYAELLESQRATKKYMDEVNENSNLSGANVLFNGSYFDKDGKVKFDSSKNGLFNAKDKFGLTQLDYLRDIRKALIHGIKVFPDGRIDSDSGWNPNIDLMSKEENENDSYKESLGHNTKAQSDDYEDLKTNPFDIDQENFKKILEETKRKNKKGKYGKGISEKIDKVTGKVDKFVDWILYGKDYTDDFDGSGGDEIAIDDGDGGGSLKDRIMEYFTGKSDKIKDNYEKAKGILGDIGVSFMKGFNDFKISLFGEKKLSEQKDSLSGLTDVIKERMPKAFREGLKSGLIKTIIASKMGALGSLILPGGPIGAAVLGMGTSFLRQSETFNRWMFGEQDEDGNRTGGVIPKNLIDLYGEHGPTIKKAAGAGILASFFLPGGPILGAITGIGSSLLYKSESFQKFMFGDDLENKSVMNGAIGKLIKSLSKKDEKVNANPELATFLGGTGLAIGLGQGIGLLPSMLLPGGPILGSIIGLSTGIAASSEKFQKLLFGEKDEDGKRYGGLLTKFTNWFDTSVVGSLKLKMTEANDMMYKFLHEKVLFPIQDALAPIKQLGINVLDDIKEAFHNVTDPVVDSFKEHVTKPLGEWMKKNFLDPITRTMKGMFRLIGKAIGGIVTSPIKILTGLGNIADHINERGAIRQEKRNRREQFKEAIRQDGFVGMVRGFKNLKISDEEREELLSTGRMQYRADREKQRTEREAKLQAEMEERQNKRDELNRQFEEDVAFGKGSGWKWGSKKQKEKREQEIKEKQAWMQEKATTETVEMNQRIKSIKDLLFDNLGISDEQTDVLRNIKDLLYKLITGKDPKTDDISVGELPKRNRESDEEIETVEAEIVNDGDRANIPGMNDKSKKGVFKSVIDALRDAGQSHAEGLDIVPSDGYIAELHEGEMVLPKGPAENIRETIGKGNNVTSLFSKMLDREKQDRDDNALGLTDEEANQMKEINDLKRYEDISKQDVGYVMERRAKEQKEKEEKQWKNSVLEAIYGVTAGVATGAAAVSDLGSSLLDGISSLMDKLGITGLLAALAGVLGGTAISHYSDIAAQTGNSVLDVMQGEGREERKDADGSYVYDNQVISGGSKLARVSVKPVTKLYNAGKNVVSKTIDTYNNTKNAINNLMGRTTDDVAEGTIKAVDITDDVAKKSTTVVDDLITMGKNAIKILSDKAVEKFPKLKPLVGSFDDVFKKIASMSDTIFKEFGTKITTFIADLGLDFTGVGTAVEFAMTAYDILSGYYSGNVGNLFGVPKDHVDIDMKNITAFLQGLCKFSFMAVIWLINEITSSLMGLDFLQNIARMIYRNLPINLGKDIDLTNDLEGVNIDSMTVEQAIEAAGGNVSMFKDKSGNIKDLTKLDDKDLVGTGVSSAEIMELQRLQYNQQNGTKLDSLAWKDKTSATLGSKIWDGVKDYWNNTSTGEKLVDGIKLITDPFETIGGKIIESRFKDSNIRENVSETVGKVKDGAVNLYNTTKDNVVKGYNVAKDWTTDKFNAGKEWVMDKGGKFINEAKEFGSNPLAYTLNKTGDLAEKTYFKSKELVGEGVDWVKDKFSPVTNKVKEGYENIKNNVTGKLKEKFGFVTEGFEEDDSAGTKAAKIVKNIYQAIDDKKDEIIKNISDTFNEALEKIGKGFKYLKEDLPKKVIEFKDKVVDGFEDGVKKVGDWFVSLKTKIPKKINEVKDTLQKGFTDMLTNVKNAITEKVNDIKKFFSKENITKSFEEKVNDVKEAWGNFTDSFTKIFNDLKSSFKLPKITIPDLSVTWDNVKDFFKDFAKELFNAGNSGILPTDKIRPIKYRATDSDFISPTNNNTTNNTTNTNTNNKFVFYNQSDKRWGSNKMGDSTMKDSGCGPTSLAMAISQLTGEQITPDTVAKLGQEHLPGYSKYSLFPSVAEKLNMNYNEGYDGNFIVNNLRNGVPVILSGKTAADGTPYTSEGHVVTATRIDGNKVFINDPRGKEYSGFYPLNSILTGLNKGMTVSPSNRTDVSRLSSGQLLNGWADDEYEGLYRNDLGIYGDVGEYEQLDGIGGKTGASQITMADRVLSYARAFLNNTSKFSYSQPRRLQIDNNKGNGADCSSFVSHVLSRAGDVNIYGTTSQTFWDKVGTKVDEPQIGDVVCQVGHVGLYSGDGNYIHMSGRKHGIKESKAIQNGNNKHRGYKRVLQNPSQLVDPTVPNANSLLGTVVGTSSGQPVTGSGGSTATTTTGETTTTSSVDPMGVFGQLSNIGNNMIASIFNGRDVDLYASPVSETTTTTSSTGNPDISGISDNAKAVYTFFTGKGYTPEVAAGILGNMTQESGVNPTAIQGGGKGPAAGICQWENYNKKSARWKGLSDYAASKGKEWTDLQSQLEWLDLELQGKDSTTLSLLKKYVGGYEQFKALTDVRKATKVFEDSFERAGKPNMERRYSAAETYYNQFKSGTATDANSALSSNDAGGFATATSAETAPADGSIPTSMNGWAYYKQTDPQWQNGANGRIGKQGCGMSSHAMMLTSMFGKQITPVTVGEWAIKNGHWPSGMSWSMPNAIANAFGLDITDSKTNSNGLPDSAIDAVKSEIKAGRPVILSGKGKSGDTSTPFTSGGHIVLAVGVDGNNRLIINDPRGTQYTKAYEDSNVMNIGTGMRGYWAFNTTANSKIPESWTVGSDFTAGSYTGTTTTDGTTTTTSAPSVDPMGVFGQLSNIGNNMIASIFNGRDMFDTTTSGTTATSGSSLSAGDFIGKVSSKYEVSYPTNRGDFISDGASWGDPGGTSYGLPQFATNTGSAKSFAQWLSGKVDTSLGTLTPNTSAFNTEWKAIPGKIGMDKFEQLQGQYAFQLLGEPFGNKWLTATGLTMKNRGFQEMLYSAGIQHGPGTAKKYAQGISSSMTDEAIVDKFYDNRGELNSTTGSVKSALKKRFANERNDIKALLSSPVASTDTVSSNDSAGMGDGETHWAKGFGDNKPEKVSYSKGHAGMGDGTTTTDLVNSRRNMEKTIREIDRNMNVVNNTTNISSTNISDACVEMLKTIVQELQSINNNTAETAKGISEIEIVSANTPVSSSSSNKNTRRNSNDLNHSNPNTGYDLARRIASYK